MGHYLSDEESAQGTTLLALLYSLPYGVDMVGPVWEQIFARMKGGEWSQKRDNRPNPDVVVRGVRYCVKTERLDHALSRERRTAADFLGYHEDLIVARPPVDELLKTPEELHALPADELGARVLRAYNAIAQRNWDCISVLLRVRGRQFIYWEMDPPIYDVDGYTWTDSGKARGQSRNINSVPRPAKFKWTSRGSQFYVRYAIPENADILTIQPNPLSWDELLVALRRTLQAPRQRSPEIPQSSS